MRHIKFIAIAMVGLFTCASVGMASTSFSREQVVTIKKGFEDVSLCLIMDAESPSVLPKYGKMITVLSEDDTINGHVSDIETNSNDPPFIRWL